MKYFGNIENNLDIVNKEYVDNHSGSPNDGKLQVDVDTSGSPSEIFTANQSGNSTLNFIAGTGIKIEKGATASSTTPITITNIGTVPNDGSLLLGIENGAATKIFSANQSSDSTITLVAGSGISIQDTTQSSSGVGDSSGSESSGTTKRITISATGGTSSNSYIKYDSPEWVCKLDTSYKHHVVVLNQTVENNNELGITTPNTGIKSYQLGFGTDLSAGNEFYVYITANVQGCQLAIPSSFTFASDRSAKVLFNGSWTNNSTVVDFSYDPDNGSKPIITSLTLHILYDGTYLYIDSNKYTVIN